ncbi:bifunctional class I SAM-dependent methyltransferase/glycosyltransferase family 2 protein [Saccharicrinis aurantiacus]|uniref:bifunctional class I SAM-dependent methyltransferase/glycosyltransferase family 2 protein n=1 Tax=Saccharicrinis aurantiacus TaxID=1849719 RepID=UPI00249372C4|nr:bifunctional class I SAM-dependent methyltransferase/glycosyltransferase family 2 protein [Saccharicrinis aurantiacus]
MTTSTKSVIKEYWNNFAPKWNKYRKNRAYYWNSISKYCNYFIQEDSSVLEVGCGTGDLLQTINCKRKVGIDFSIEMIKLAKEQHSEIEFHEMEAENISLNEKFDVIILSNVIGLLPDIEHVFKQLHNVTHPKTRIIVTYYNRLWEPIIRFAELLRFKRKSPQQNWLSTKDIENLLYLSDFDAYKSNRNMLVPYNIPIISGFLNRIISRLPLFNKLGLNTFVFARPIPKILTPDERNKLYSTSVVIPARNESGNIEDAIKRIPDFGKHIEIIFVEGNSTDNTWETIQSMKNKYQHTHDIKIMQQTGKGKGDAVRKGYDAATGDILMILDADLTVPPEDLPKFYDAIASGKGEFINGVRLVYPMEKNAMRPLNTIGNHFFSKLFSYILERPIKDTLCGTKVMFRKDYLKLAANRKFFGEFDPFGDFDLLFGAYKLNLKLIDLPIRYKERKYGDTNISRFRHGLILLRMSAFAAIKIKFW